MRYFLRQAWRSFYDWMVYHPPDTGPPSGCTVTEINRILVGAAHDREMLEARFKHLLELHEYEIGSDEADDLAHVIFGGANYQDTMRLIMRRRWMYEQDC